MVTRSDVLVAVLVVLSVGIGTASVATAREGDDSMTTTTSTEAGDIDTLEMGWETDAATDESTSIDDVAEDATFDEVTSVLEMPGEITDSNAHEVDGNVATWHLHEAGRLAQRDD